MTELKTEKFITNSKKVHGDNKYDYSLTEYINSNTKVTIICKTHGKFMQTPYHHLQGGGCKQCYHESLKLTTTDFINKANIVHNFKFSYLKTDYKNSKSKVVITCPFHGDFEQGANTHLQGYGCSKCAGNDRYTFESLSDKILEIHKGSIKLLEFQTITNVASKYKFQHISCGHIWESPANSVLSGTGCPSCAGNSPYDEVELAKAILIRHKGEVTLVESQKIIGVGNKYYFKHSCGHTWEASANHVLRGSSCPLCSEHGFNSSKEAVFYILPIKGSQQFTGFGISNNYLKRRTQHVNNLKVCGCEIDAGEVVLNFNKGYDALQLESYIKSIIGRKGVSSISGFKTESTNMTVEELKMLCNNWITNKITC